MTRRAREDDNEEEFRGLREEHPFLPTRATSADLLASVFRFMPQPPQEFYEEVRNFDWRVRRFIQEAHHYIFFTPLDTEAHALMRREIDILEKAMREMHYVINAAHPELFEPWGMYPDEAIRMARKVKIALSFFMRALVVLGRKELRDLTLRFTGSMDLSLYGGPESLPFALVGSLSNAADRVLQWEKIEPFVPALLARGDLVERMNETQRVPYRDQQLPGLASKESA